MEQVKLGEMYMDTISGFKGVAFSRTTYQHDRARVALRAKVGSDGKLPELEYFEEASLVPGQVA